MLGKAARLDYPKRHEVDVYVKPRMIAAALDADQLFSVTQLGLDLGVSARTIRFYEDKGLIAPQRAGNNRVYTQRDRARMILILRGKKLGFSLREIKEYLDLYDADPTHARQLRLLLKAVRSRIARLRDQRAALEEALGELLDVEAQAQEALDAREGTARRAPRPVQSSEFETQ